MHGAARDHGMREPGEEKSESGSLLETMGRLASAGGLGDVIEIVRISARNLIGAQGISFILRDGDTCHYVEEDAIGPLWKDKRFPLSSCISGWAMLHRQRASIPDITTDPRIPQELYRSTFVRSLLMVPVGSTEPIGAIGAYWDHRHEAGEKEIETLEAIAGACTTALDNARLLSALSHALSEAELARDELRHRVKNAYASMQALAVLLLPAEYAQEITRRVAGLLRAHELLDGRLARNANVSVREILDMELAPYVTETPGRLAMNGPHVALKGALATTLALAVNELATNALKYGALSVESGHLTIDWTVTETHLRIHWIESDGPEVAAAAVESFGSRLLRRLVEGQLQGTISRKLVPSGVVCEMEFPLDNRNRGHFTPIS